MAKTSSPSCKSSSAARYVGLLSAAISGAAAVAAYSLPLKLNIVAAIAIAVAICFLLDRKDSERAAA